jgi:hypothetical protein
VDSAVSEDTRARGRALPRSERYTLDSSGGFRYSAFTEKSLALCRRSRMRALICSLTR